MSGGYQPEQVAALEGELYHNPALAERILSDEEHFLPVPVEPCNGIG